MAGRPTNYQPEFCEMLIEHMAKGYSFESFGWVIKRARSTIFLWKQEGSDSYQKDFADAYELAKDGCLYWYEKQAIENMVGGQINTGVWALNMRNRFGWKDKIEVSGPDNQPLVLGYALKPKEEKGEGASE